MPCLYIGFGAGPRVSVGTTTLAQVVAGFQWRGAFDAALLLGWSQVVAGHRVRSDALLDARQRAWIRDVTGSGPVVALSLGFALGK